MTGPGNARCAVEASTNMVNWTALRTNVLTDGTFDFLDTTSVGKARRFYRGRLVP